MEVVEIESRKNKGMVLVHRCGTCGKTIANKLAPDDDYLPMYRRISREKERELRFEKSKF